jgi:hypothetical protein
MFVSYDGVLCAKEIQRLGPMELKIYTPSKIPATVTQQLTKSVDFRQNYLLVTSIFAIRSRRR